MCLWRCRSLRFARHMTASLIASLLSRCIRRVPVPPSVPSLLSSHDGVAHCVASLALRATCACGAVGSLRYARHVTALLTGSLLSRGKRRVAVAPSVPSLLSSHDGVAHCVASLALQATCACGAVGSLRFAHHVTALLTGSLLSRGKWRVPVAPSAFCFARHRTVSLIASLLLRR